MNDAKFVLENTDRPDVYKNTVTSGSRIAIVVYCKGTNTTSSYCPIADEMWYALNRLALPADSVIIVVDAKGDAYNPDFEPALDTPTGLAVWKRTTVCYTGGGAGRIRAYDIGIALALRTNAGIIAFLDGDSLPHPMWTYETMRFFKHHPGICIVTGESIAKDQNFPALQNEDENCPKEQKSDEDVETNEIDMRNFAIVRPVAEADLFDNRKDDSPWLVVCGAIHGFRTGYNPNIMVYADPWPDDPNADDFEDF